MNLLALVARERARALRLLRTAISARALAAAVAVLSVGALALGSSRWIVLPRPVPFLVWGAAAGLAVWMLRRGARAVSDEASSVAIAGAVEREQKLRDGSVRGIVELAENKSVFVRRAAERLASTLAPRQSPLAPALERGFSRSALRSVAVIVPAVLIGTLVAARSGDGWRALAHPVDAWRGALLPKN